MKKKILLILGCLFIISSVYIKIQSKRIEYEDSQMKMYILNHWKIQELKKNLLMTENIDNLFNYNEGVIWKNISIEKSILYFEKVLSYYNNKELAVNAALQLSIIYFNLDILQNSYEYAKTALELDPNNITAKIILERIHTKAQQQQTDLEQGDESEESGFGDAEGHGEKGGEI